eukprot:COSAG02_NODE_32025_length_523_cov_0.974057_2_plen_85_part_01
MEAIQQLKQMVDDGDEPQLLRCVANPTIEAPGRFGALDWEPTDSNDQQLKIMRTLHCALEVIQGPPGCGKTKLIADILTYCLPQG